MKKELIKLKNLRILRDNQKKLMDSYKATFETEHSDQILLMNKTQEEIIDAEKKVKDMAILIFENNEEKKLDYGVGIRILAKLDYDPADAFSWAKEHSLALTLDKKAFEKIAKIDNIDFVQIREEATATIPTEIKIEEGEVSDD